MRRLAQSFAVAAMLAGASAGNAVVLFSDNFDTATNVLNISSLPGWTITGQVDLVAQANPYGIGSCVSGCLDLDGTPGPGEILSDSIAFSAGKQVLIKFDLSGNQRGGPADDFFFEDIFGAPLTYNNNILTGFLYGSTGIYTNASSGVYSETLVAGKPYVTYTYGFIPTVAGSMRLRFGTSSGDRIGPILDNVMVSQVPEPASWAMMITGFGLVGFAARRRRGAVAA